MVGVGGRSGGCHTCRRRRVKCDETHPKCSRCAKAKIECEGYARDLKFVDEKGRAQKRVQVKRQAYLEAVQAEDEQYKANRKVRVVPKREQVVEQVQPTLSLAAFRDKVELTFMLNKLFWGWRLFIPWVMKGYSGSADCTTTQTVNALSSVYFARLHRDGQSFNNGMASYSKALRLMSGDLKDSKAAFDLPLVTNALALVIFEMMASSFGGMVQHLGGVQRLIQARGPERHQTRPELDVFESARMGMAHQAMERRKRCFLNEEAWRTIPWLKHPEVKTPVSRICDIKIQIPELLEDMETLQIGGGSSPTVVRELCQRIAIQFHEIYVWRAAWEAANPNCTYLVQISDPNVPYTSAIHFTSITRAVEMGHYNSCLIQLYRIGRMLMGPAFSSTTPAMSIPITRTNSALLLPGDPKTIHDIGMEFLRTADYELLEPHRSAGFFQLMFPLRVIFEVYRPGSREWDYCQSLFNEMAEKGGFELAKRMMPRGIMGRMLMDEHINT